MVWRAVDRSADYSDAQLVEAAEQRVAVLLQADADSPDRAEQILSGATGDFHDAFAQSADAYTRYVKREGAHGDATIDAAALAARMGESGVVLVAAGLQVSTDDAAPLRQQIRLRVTVEPDDGQLKLSTVEFVP